MGFSVVLVRQQGRWGLRDFWAMNDRRGKVLGILGEAIHRGRVSVRVSRVSQTAGAGCGERLDSLEDP